MKVTTDLNGVTTCELHKQDRIHLAAVKTLLSKIAYHERVNPCITNAYLAEEFIGELLAPEKPAPASPEEPEAEE